MLQRIAEVIEATTTDFVAQCYELYGLPSLGSLVKTADGALELYGVVCHATTAGLEPGRRPIARGKDEPDEEAIYRASPQLNKLLRSEFSALLVGHRRDGTLRHYLPPRPARIHSFVHECSADEVRGFSGSFAFLNLLLNPRLPTPTEELAAACLRQMSTVQPDPRAFLVAAGKELATLLSSDFNRLKAVLERIRA